MKNTRIKKEYSYINEEFTIEQLFYISSVLEETQSRITKYAINKRTVLEMAIIRMCDKSLSDSPKALAARISELEKKLSVMAVTGFVPQDNKTVFEPHETPVQPIQNIVDVHDETIEREEFKNISDVYDFMSNNPSQVSFLTQTKVFCEGNKIIVSGQKFAIDMIQIEGVDSLSNAFASVIGQKVEIVFEEAEKEIKNTDQVSFINDL